MSKLEQIIPGCSIKGITGETPVTVIAVSWIGENAVELTYKLPNGTPQNQLLYRDSESIIEVLDNELPWSFDADGNLLRLVSEAYRIELAHLFDPYLAVHTSQVEPLPHQISAVYQEMLPRLPLRYILADDPGAGKTIMTGLLLRELMVRGDVKRCLIVAPGSLSEQWQDEMLQKFHIRFEILTNDRIEAAASGNIFTEMNFCIARLDKLSRDEGLQKKLAATDWDLIVVDEAHKMAATIWGGEIKYTKRFQLGRLLSDITRHFLLLTATPHNGKEEDFQLFLSLIDPDRFEGALRTSHQTIDVSDVMRRLVKEELLKFDGTRLFPERIAYTLNYDLSDAEATLYQEVTTYVQEEFNRADNLKKERKNTVGFALTILQRRLASSPEAIYQSLRRRKERLEDRLRDEKLGRRVDDIYSADLNDEEDKDAFEDIPSDERENDEEQLVDSATAAQTIEELEAEIKTLTRLEKMANDVRTSGTDRKWEELSKLLQDNERMYDEGGQREKLIIFTEHRDTLNYLTGKIRSMLGNDEAVVTIHGGMLRDDRRKVENLFCQDINTRILVATDAAGEGINLQRAHLMINYDLPWNPNRLEQRFGRIHRIGQTEVCYLWNLVSKETREGAVFEKLFSKLDEERNALGGKVFDILGKMTFDNKPLRELLIEAIRYGNQPEVKNRLNQVVDKSFDKKAFQDLLDKRALTEDTMDIHKIMAIKEDMERMEAHKLQPFFIESFFMEAFQKLGGTIRQREKSRYEITSVPLDIRNRDMLIGFSEPVLKRYERVCFERELCNIQGEIPAALICPGHPLLEATIDLIREKNSDVLKRGAILIDDQGLKTEPRLLFYIEDSIQDGKVQADGKRRIISRNIHFVEMDKTGKAVNAGYAPYLDYRAARPEETEKIKDYIKSQEWLTHDVELKARDYAASEIIPQHYQQVKEHRVQMADKTEKAVTERLRSEIQYWDFRAGELKQKEEAGKTNAKLNSDNAARRADNLAGRLKKRMEELEQEKQVSPLPPAVIGGAIIIPRVLLNELMGMQADPELFGKNRKEIELAAMKEVLKIEKEQGYIPRDVSADNVGYDIESNIPEDQRKGGPCLRFIEVKGRQKGSNTVTVSKNEILVGLTTENYILGIVEIDGEQRHTIYIKHPFQKLPDPSADSVNYNIATVIQSGEIILQK